MDIEFVADTYKKGLGELSLMVSATEKEVIHGTHGVSLVTDNINFFTKSFLISTCAHLEMCVKEIVFAIATDIDARLSSASVPLSIVEWRYNQKAKKEASKTNANCCAIGMSRKEVDDLVSGNVYRTKDALLLVGVDLASDVVLWESWKDLIQAIVTRRNNIVHHNDDASDLSLGDIRSYINSVIEYINFIVNSCNTANNAPQRTR